MYATEHELLRRYIVVLQIASTLVHLKFLSDTKNLLRPFYLKFCFKSILFEIFHSNMYPLRENREKLILGAYRPVLLSALPSGSLWTL